MCLACYEQGKKPGDKCLIGVPIPTKEQVDAVGDFQERNGEAISEALRKLKSKDPGDFGGSAGDND